MTALSTKDKPPKPRLPSKEVLVADILDAAFKDDVGSMEHPLFVLQAGDRRVREYERGGYIVKIKPGPDGCATIHDKDVWIFCISQLAEAMNRGDEIGPTIHFTAYDFLKFTNRQTSGPGYELMLGAMRRLSGTQIETNIPTGGIRTAKGFGMIDSWGVAERATDNRMVLVEVTLPQWLYRSIQAMNVLTLSRDYFKLRKPLARRLYELARKHCGKQKQWKASVATLYEKSGSSTHMRDFRSQVKILCEPGQIPDYEASFDVEADMVTFKCRKE